LGAIAQIHLTYSSIIRSIFCNFDIHQYFPKKSAKEVKMSSKNYTSTWEQLLEIAQQNTPARRIRRPGQAPSSAPIPSSLHKLPVGETPPVLLYRDTNSWCPFCERVWFAVTFSPVKSKIITGASESE